MKLKLKNIEKNFDGKLEKKDSVTIIKISLCSKKSFKLTKSARNKSKKVDISFRNSNSEVEIKREDEHIERFFAYNISDLPEGQHEELKIGDMKVPIRKGRGDSLITYWEDPFIGITKLLDYVTDFFDSPIYELSLSAKNHPKDPRRTVDWIMGRQGSIASVNFECKETTEEELKYFLDTCKITEYLDMVVKTSEQFKHTINFELEILMLKHAHWVTLDNIFSLNYRVIFIEHSNFTSVDINVFLKRWVNNVGNSRLGMVEFRTNEPTSLGTVTAELNAIRRTYDKKKVFKFLEEDDGITFNESHDIRRNDGVMGSIMHYPGVIKFLIWPDYENTPYS